MPLIPSFYHSHLLALLVVGGPAVLVWQLLALVDVLALLVGDVATLGAVLGLALLAVGAFLVFFLGGDKLCVF